MNSFILSLLFVTSAFAVDGNVSDFSAPSLVHKSSIVIGDHLYFTDPSVILRSRAQAVAWCQSQGAQLAKVTNFAMYTNLRFALPSPSAYWIDGIDKENDERFAVTNNCTPDQFDFSGIPANNLRLPARTCLALVKGTTEANSRIEAMDCIIPNRVVCSHRLGGCMA